MLFASLLLYASAFGYEKEIDALSAAMAEKIAGKGKKMVAVADFTDLQGNVTELGRFIAEELSGSLAGKEKGFEVVNRSNLKQLLQEHKLFATGAIDQKAAMKLGEISGLQALVTGTITPFTESVRVSTSVLDINTAKVIDNEKANIARTKDINELLEKPVTVAAADEGNGAETQKAAAKPAQPKNAKGDSGPFSDNFDNGPKPDWKPINGNWTMSNGQYTVTDINGKEKYITFLDEKKWSNFIMEIDVTPGHVDGECAMTICPRMISDKEKICFGMSGREYKFNEAYWFIHKDGSNGEATSNVSVNTSAGQPARVKIEVKNGVFTSYVNGTQANQIYDKTFSSGSIGLRQWYEYWDGNKIRISFDNIEIKPLAD